MNIYEVYYRKRGDKDAELLRRDFSAPTKESVKLIAQGVISSDFVIVKIVKI